MVNNDTSSTYEDAVKQKKGVAGKQRAQTERVVMKTMMNKTLMRIQMSRLLTNKMLITQWLKKQITRMMRWQWVMETYKVQTIFDEDSSNDGTKLGDKVIGGQCKEESINSLNNLLMKTIAMMVTNLVTEQ
jgi:hypothetical protein